MGSSFCCTCGHNISFPIGATPFTEAPCEHCCEAPLVLLGEAWGEAEEQVGLPFQGTSGRELRDQCESSGIKNAFLTSTLNKRPARNSFKSFCVPAKDPEAMLPSLGETGFANRSIFGPELKRLGKELEKVKPNLVVALGNVALWAMTEVTPKISKSRGTIAWSSKFALSVLPTYHPAAVLCQYKWRSIAQADLRKAKVSSRKVNLKQRKRTFLVSPTQADINQYISQHLEPATLISFDIETLGNRFITCIGFAPSGETAMVIPFVHEGKPYWASFEEELWAWKAVRRILALPAGKLAQNGLYDIQYLYHHGIPVRGFLHDTMLLHHALQPEMEKSLGFLASIYLDDAVSWKGMRTLDKTGK